MAAKKKEQGPSVVSATIEWRYPEGLTGSFANHVLVQDDGHEFHISFFEVKPPVILGDVQDRKKQAAELKSVPAVCVARIIVSEGRMSTFVRTLQESLEKHLQRSKPHPDDDNKGKRR